jgi:S-DNA-T family DNA segregation ATPase FtsK/SpoIIIE
MSIAFAWNGDNSDDVVDAEIVGEDTFVPPPLPPRSAAVVPVPTPTRVPTSPQLAAPRFTLPVPRSLAERVLMFVLVNFWWESIKGGGLWIRGWWRWVMLVDETEAAKREGKASINARDRRKDRQKYGKISAVLAVVLLIAVTVFLFVAPVEAHLAAALVLMLGMWATGHQWQPRRPADARGPWDGSIGALRAAHVEAGIIDEFADIQPIGLPAPTGSGILVVYDLPGVSWEVVRDKLTRLAAALRVTARYMTVERGIHEAQVILWIPIGDPFARGAVRHPLLDEDRWDAWDPAPFGETARGQVVPLRLLYSNYLGGGKPASGKTFAARSVAAPFILDHDVDLYCANGKGDPAWDAIEPLCEVFICGRSDDHARRVSEMLDRVRDEMNDRMTNRRRMTGSQIEPGDGLRLLAVIIDELQNYTTNGQPCDKRVYGRKATVGQYIDFQLTDIVKNGRCAGVILIEMTQKPSEKSLCTDHRDQVGTRFCTKVMTYQTSNMILGASLSKFGYDASQLPGKHRGLGILVPDMEENVLDDAIGDNPTVRPYFISDEDWRDLCARGLRLREEAGTTPTPVTEYPLPEVLQQILDHVQHDTDDTRVSSVELMNLFDPHAGVTKFGIQLRKWGCPCGREPGNKGRSGPVVGDIRRAAERIRTTGVVDVVSAA